MTSGVVLVLSGPSGVGKGTVHSALRTRLPHARLSVSVTTREPRSGEVDGVDYVFVTDTEFDELVAAGALLEHAEYAGSRYGTRRAPVEDGVASGDVVVLDIDVQGALQVRDALTTCLMIFLAPPSMDELERRLRARGTEDDAAIRRRLTLARGELAQQDEFDLVVVNDDLERCVDAVVRAVDAWCTTGEPTTTTDPTVATSPETDR